MFSFISTQHINIFLSHRFHYSSNSTFPWLKKKKHLSCAHTRLRSEARRFVPSSPSCRRREERPDPGSAAERAKAWRAMQDFTVHQDPVNDLFIGERGSPVQHWPVSLSGAFTFTHDARRKRDRNLLWEHLCCAVTRIYSIIMLFYSFVMDVL